MTKKKHFLALGRSGMPRTAFVEPELFSGLLVDLYYRCKGITIYW